MSDKYWILKYSDGIEQGFIRYYIRRLFVDGKWGHFATKSRIKNYKNIIPLWNLIDKADMIISRNLKGFDRKD